MLMKGLRRNDDAMKIYRWYQNDLPISLLPFKNFDGCCINN